MYMTELVDKNIKSYCNYRCSFNQVVECQSMLSRDTENILKDLNKASRNEKYNG